MDRILYTAMSGAKQGMDRQALVSQNLANVTTAGFRAQLYAARAVPVQGEAPLHTRASTVASSPGSDFSPGPISTTGRPLDVLIEQDGWLAVQADDGTEAYTRRGDLQIDANGVVVVVGRPVVGDNGPIIVPLDSQVVIGSDGTLSAIGPGEGPEAIADVGRVKLVDPGEQTLIRGEDGLFRPPEDEDGEVAVLGQDEDLRLVVGSLEGSNVSAVEAMTAMIDAARHYEMQLSMISTTDENAQRANSLLSLQG
ncbi:flagellar basal body rod protein FlgF [Halochromatium salexigens]|uniref:Flagellar basal-body rod protein FlgF n=1 Tax=Halochromatium salexigens TaxID=49447 RepID=A0AAJ0UE56_HALSE|nr:flagellar basal body rod protein FlgF [Halochromatium salexigens]MBK5929778.1 flagellar biosynthesis protein FlgF [Halochromatium salexigens]